MTIGPEPRTRIRWRSSLRGTGDLLHELVEEPERVVRTGSGFGVVLHAAGGDVEQPDALDRPVVEVEARELDVPEVGVDADRRLLEAPLDREAVVLRGD